MNNILITGANRGLGLEMSRQYLQAGWKVFACCRFPLKSQELKSLQQEFPERLEIIKLNVTKAADIEHLVEYLQNRPIDILVNNAGIFGPKQMSFGSLTPAPWKEVLATNTIAPFMIAQALIEHVVSSQRRIIVNISSTMGSIAPNIEGNEYIYRSSKAALNAISKSLSIDLRPRGVIVVALHPGWVKTDLGGINAKLTPKESVRGMRSVLDKLSLKDTGSFIRYDGRRLTW